MALSVFTRGLKRILAGGPDALSEPDADAVAIPPSPEPLFPVPQGRVPVPDREDRRAREDVDTAAVQHQTPPQRVAAGPPPPTIIVRPIGAMANRMIQHMVAMKIASLVPGARISRIHLPEWGIDEPDLPDVPEPAFALNHMQVDIAATALALREQRARSVAITGYVQHMNNLLGPEAYRRMFSKPDLAVESYGADVLLINIRGAEILTGQYPPYVLVPIAFYQQIVRETGLRPVFFGQLSDCPYMDELRATFPDATFRHGAGVIHDFEVLRRSRNICMSVSTFSWAACWLSDADRIFMPLTGLFNPVHGIIATGGHNLVPVDDNRFLFYNFMQNEGVPQDRYREIHKIMEGNWKLVTGAWVTNMLERRRHGERRLEDYLAVFDEDYYLRLHGELAMAKASGMISSGRSHYEMHGFREGRQPCHMDISYAYRHPDAGMAVSNGDYLDLLHFHVARGRQLGYRLYD